MSDRTVVDGIMIVKAGIIAGGQGKTGLKYLKLNIVFGVKAGLSTSFVCQGIVFEGGQGTGSAALLLQDLYLNITNHKKGCDEDKHHKTR
jgi:hypothetical protein